LPQLAAVLEKCALFLGHDSGISHLAAAVGTRCVLLFGGTDPAVWGPANPSVEIVQAEGGDLGRLSSELLQKRIETLIPRLANA
jgi:heptosyltransferase-2